jgi:hypothetical protein
MPDRHKPSILDNIAHCFVGAFGKSAEPESETVRAERAVRAQKQYRVQKAAQLRSKRTTKISDKPLNQT